MMLTKLLILNGGNGHLNDSGDDTYDVDAADYDVYDNDANGDDVDSSNSRGDKSATYDDNGEYRELCAKDK